MHPYIIHIISKIQRKILLNLLAYNEKGKPCRTSLILLLAEGEGVNSAFATCSRKVLLFNPLELFRSSYGTFASNTVVLLLAKLRIILVSPNFSKIIFR